MTRSENIEELLAISKSMDLKETSLKRKLYNLILLRLKLYDAELERTEYDEMLASIIIQEVGHHYLVCDKYNELNSRKRKHTVPKFVSIWLISLNTKLKYTAISELFGYPHHSMVVHAKKTISNLISTDKDFKNSIQILGEKLRLKY